MPQNGWDRTDGLGPQFRGPRLIQELDRDRRFQVPGARLPDSDLQQRRDVVGSDDDNEDEQRHQPDQNAPHPQWPQRDARGRPPQLTRSGWLHRVTPPAPCSVWRSSNFSYARTMVCTNSCRTTSLCVMVTMAIPSIPLKISRASTNPDVRSRGRSICVTSPV